MPKSSAIFLLTNSSRSLSVWGEIGTGTGTGTGRKRKEQEQEQEQEQESIKCTHHDCGSVTPLGCPEEVVTSFGCSEEVVVLMPLLPAEQEFSCISKL